MQRPSGTGSRGGGQFLVQQIRLCASPAPSGDAYQRSSHTFKEKFARILGTQDIPVLTLFCGLLRKSCKMYVTQEYTSGAFSGQAQALSKQSKHIALEQRPIIKTPDSRQGSSV
jgi:hypothetical protein